MKKVFILATDKKQAEDIMSLLRILGDCFEEVPVLNADTDICVFSPEWQRSQEGNRMWDICKKYNVKKAKYLPDEDGIELVDPISETELC